MTKSGLIKDERDTVTRRVRHRDGKLLRGGIGLTTGLGWSDRYLKKENVFLFISLTSFFNSEDEDAPSPLTRRLSSLNLSRRSSASSIHSATPPLSSSSSLRRIHPLSRSYSSGAILETEREHDEPQSFDEYSSCPYDYDEDEEEEEDRTIEETGHWAQSYRLGQTSPPVSWQRRCQPPPSRTRKNHQIQTTAARTSTGSVGSGFSLEVTIPEGSTGVVGEERSKTPSRLRRPSSHTSFKSSSIGVDGGGRDSSGSSSLDSRFSGFSSSGQQDSSNNGNHNCGSGNGNTPSSTSSTLSIPMPSTPKDIFNPAAPPMLSSTRGMSLMNKEKSLPPLPAGGLKKKSSGNLQRSIISNSKSSTISTTGTTATAGALNGTGKYAFPSSRIRTFSSTSTSTPYPSSPVPDAAILSPSSSAATIKPNVRPLQLPRQTSTRVVGGDRPAVPVPSPTLNSLPLPLAVTAINNSSLRAPTPSLSTLSPRHRPSPITPILPGHTGTSSAPASPAINGGVAVTTIRPKPRTGTGMVYRTSSYGVGGSKMRAPMILSGSSTNGSLVSSSSGGGGSGVSAIGGPNNFSEAIAL